MQAEPCRILLGELFPEMKILVGQKLKLSASTFQAVFIVPNQQGQGRGDQCSFAVSLVCACTKQEQCRGCQGSGMQPLCTHHPAWAQASAGGVCWPKVLSQNKSEASNQLLI